MESLSVLLCFVLAWIVIFHFVSNAKSNPRKLPPGPSPLPIIGNLLSIGSKPHISLTQLANTFGPLMTLQLGQVPTVVISSAEVAKEALRKNDLTFANRMMTDAVRALNHHEKSIIFLAAGPQWLNLRKICNSQVLSAARLEASEGIRKTKLNELITYVQNCSQKGVVVDIGQAAFATTLNLLSTIFFSVDLGDPSSEFTSQLKQLMRAMVEEAGKPNLADYFPFLRKMDPQGIRRRTSVHFEKMTNLFKTMIDQRLHGDTSPASTQGTDVLDALLYTNPDTTQLLEPSDIPHLLLDLFTAGTDTTSNTLEWAMAELLHNPEKLKKTQAELEEMIGKGNPINEPDIARLQYLQAVVKETLRLHPPVSFVPRQVDSDVKIFDYTIPKNAQVLVNAYAIGRDGKIWENPNFFEPERFLGSDIDVKGQDFELIPFGAGRRICPGLPLATRMLHLMLASLIHGFDWKLENGVSPEKLDMEDKFGITLQKAQGLRAIPSCTY